MRSMLLLLAVSLIACASAAQVRDFKFTQFTAPDLQKLVTVGGSLIDSNKLRLTNGQQFINSAAYYIDQVWLDEFTLEVSFLITDLVNTPTNPLEGYDGLTLIFQGEAKSSVGPNAGGLGYGSTPTFSSNGISKSLAIEVDTAFDPVIDQGTTIPQISIHSKGEGKNSAVESDAQIPNGIFSQFGNPRDNKEHTLFVEYKAGLITIKYDNIVTPIINTTYDMVANLKLADSLAWIGFTASTAESGDTHYITKWSYKYHAALDPARSTQEGIADVTAGATGSFSLATFDVYGHPVITGGAAVTASLVSGNPVTNLQVSDHGNGFYTVTYELTVAQAEQMQVSVNGVPISGSPFSLTVNPAQIDAAHCVASGAGLTSAKVAQQQTFTIVTNDRFGNMNSGPATFVIRATPTAGGPIFESFAPSGQGQVTIAYTMVTNGQYDLTINIDGKRLGQTLQPLFVVNCAASASKSLFDPPMAAEVTAGDPQTATLHIRDCEGNVYAGQVSHSFTMFEGHLHNPVQWPITEPPGQGGSYAYTYTLTKATSWVPYVLVNNSQVTQGVAQPAIEVSPAALDEQNSEIVWPAAPAPVTTKAGFQVVVTLLAEDQFGNQIVSNATAVQWAAEYKFQATQRPFVGSRLVPTGQVGKTLLEANFRIAATYVLTATLNGIGVRNSEAFSVIVTPGDMDISRLLVSGDQEKANEGVDNRIYMTLEDQYGNVITDQLPAKVTIERNTPKPADKDKIVTSIVWQHNGTYIVSFNPSVHGRFLLSIEINMIQWRGGPQPMLIEGGITGGQIALIILGVLAVAAAIIFGILMYKRRKKRYQSI